MKEYAGLKTRAQVERLRPIAKAACEAFGYPDSVVRLVNHGFNTTWSVTTPKGERFALRLNISSDRKPSQIRAETEWVSALSKETDLLVPVPQRSKAGEFLVWIPWIEENREVACVLYSWLHGSHVDKKMTPDLMRKIGQLTTTLHEHADGWALPEGCELVVLDDPNWNEPWNVRNETRPVFQEVYDEAKSVLLCLKETQEPRILHNDLHMHNLMVCDGRLAVFDFDDTVLSWPIQDIAISLFYFRRYEGPEYERSYMEGLGKTLEEYGTTKDELEILIAARGVFMANALLGIKTASIAAIAPRFEEVMYRRLQHFLKARVYDIKSAPWD